LRMLHGPAILNFAAKCPGVGDCGWEDVRANGTASTKQFCAAQGFNRAPTVPDEEFWQCYNRSIRRCGVDK
jgi:hypothetical protein